MTSRRALTVSAMVIWAAVAVVAAPRALSHRHSPTSSSSAENSPAETCADLHIRFEHRDAVQQSEERAISKAEAPTLRVHADSNGGVYVAGWDKDAYAVTLCKAAEAGADASSLLFPNPPILSEWRSSHFCAEFPRPLGCLPSSSTPRNPRRSTFK